MEAQEHFCPAFGEKAEEGEYQILIYQSPSLSVEDIFLRFPACQPELERIPIPCLSSAGTDRSGKPGGESLQHGSGLAQVKSNLSRGVEPILHSPAFRFEITMVDKARNPAYLEEEHIKRSLLLFQRQKFV